MPTKKSQIRQLAKRKGAPKENTVLRGIFDDIARSLSRKEIFDKYRGSIDVSMALDYIGKHYGVKVPTTLKRYSQNVVLTAEIIKLLKETVLGFPQIARILREKYPEHQKIENFEALIRNRNIKYGIRKWRNRSVANFINPSKISTPGKPLETNLCNNIFREQTPKVDALIEALGGSDEIKMKCREAAHSAIKDALPKLNSEKENFMINYKGTWVEISATHFVQLVGKWAIKNYQQSAVSKIKYGFDPRNAPLKSNFSDKQARQMVENNLDVIKKGALEAIRGNTAGIETEDATQDAALDCITFINTFDQKSHGSIRNFLELVARNSTKRSLLEETKRQKAEKVFGLRLIENMGLPARAKRPPPKDT